MKPKIIKKLAKKLAQLPSIGPRTALRIVFYLINEDKKSVDELAQLLLRLKKEIKICRFCFNPFEQEGDLCEICVNPKRNRELLCVVEKESDLIRLEENHVYNGLYFILGGTVSLLRKKDIEKLKIKELKERIKNPLQFGIKNQGFKEIIIATNPTTEGEATALYLKHSLKPIIKKLKIKITRLGRGLPTGGELEYADRETLLNAFQSRK